MQVSVPAPVERLALNNVHSFGSMAGSRGRKEQRRFGRRDAKQRKLQARAVGFRKQYWYFRFFALTCMLSYLPSLVFIEYSIYLGFY